MQHLQRISLVLTLCGLGLTFASWLLDFGEVWLLGGILLTWAGIVKIIVVQLWLRVAGLNDEHRQPTRST